MKGHANLGYGLFGLIDSCRSEPCGGADDAQFYHRDYQIIDTTVVASEQNKAAALRGVAQYHRLRKADLL